MGKKMLIDAAHREETRVAIVSGNRVENFDFESEAKRPLRGNIYLAKVTRVEPSLQAAFIEYGGNRHGFLAFSEIHPDYYQIPVADREKLLAEEAAEAFDEDDFDDEDDQTGVDDVEDSDDDDAFDIGMHAFEDETDEDKDPEDSRLDDASDYDDAAEETSSEDVEDAEVPAVAAAAEASPSIAEDAAIDGDESDDSESEEASETDAAATSEEDDGAAEVAADEDGESESNTNGSGATSRGNGRGRGRGRNGGNSRRRSRGRQSRSRLRNYKIQEVIKRRQIMLVQVVKEERGNKGAALTTYLSLAGRYCVLMPNTARGGGISRKITNTSDRRRLKEAMAEMDVATGMGLIVRTAGANRTKVEIKRDFDYLLRLWESIRDLTLKSSAPCLIYEEGDLIKRSIRDQYSKDIDEIIVDGDKAYRDAKDFMRMLMPSHAKNVKRYKDREPLLQRHGVQSELDSLLEPTVTLKSGGYIVINPTEALVSIDVNSGKSTKEHNIEATAVSTNLEAAEEIARQLRLRDMAGLIVIDFIDMDEPRNNRAVERKLKENLKQDRARIQVGRISSFGLLEMSRQRMRSGVLEGSTVPCPHCQGTGMIRSTESAALQVLRAIEAEAAKGRAKALDVSVPVDIAVFILNQKRTGLLDVEKRYRVSVYLVADGSLISPDYSIKRTDDRTPDIANDSDALSMESAFDEEEDAALDAAAEAEALLQEEDASEDTDGTGASETGDKPRRRRRRRRNRKSEDTSGDETTSTEETVETEAADAASNDADAEAADGDDEDKPRKRRRRGRRGGRRHRRSTGADGQDADANDAEDALGDTTDQAAGSEPDTSDTGASEDTPILVSYSASEAVVVEAPSEQPDDALAPSEAVASEVPAAPSSAAEPEPEQAITDVEEESVIEAESTKPAKRGWWQRRLSS